MAPSTTGTVVFILSSDRSGSTWLAYVLGSTPSAAFLGEFRRAWDPQLRRRCAWCHANGREYCEVLTSIELHTPDLAYELIFSRTGKQFLVDSSKRIVWADRFIRPGSRLKVHLIHLIRDPRGWYASERRRRESSRDGLIGEWVAENLRIGDFLKSSGAPSTTVFYDELANSPMSEFQRLCSQIGCSFEPGALRYWEKAHHGFAANGASSPLLRSLPNISELPNFITGDDAFYATNDQKSFVDQRWKEQLSEADALAIGEDARVAALLKLYDRVVTPGSLQLTRV